MNPKELVAQFIEEYLEGDINRLATFPLGNLRNDKVYLVTANFVVTRSIPIIHCSLSLGTRSSPRYGILIIG